MNIVKDVGSVIIPRCNRKQNKGYLIENIRDIQYLKITTRSSQGFLDLPLQGITLINMTHSSGPCTLIPMHFQKGYHASPLNRWHSEPSKSILFAIYFPTPLFFLACDMEQAAFFKVSKIPRAGMFSVLYF